MNEVEELRSRIHVIRGQQVMLDFDLAELYGVETSQLKRAVRRNLERFPSDFMFELNVEEFNSLKMSIRCQNGILETTPGDLPKYAPFAFTEHGVAMLSSVLRSKTAIEVNIRIMRAFVAVRRYIASQKTEYGELEARVKRLEDMFEESLRDQNEINEDTRFRLDRIEEVLAEMQTDIRHLTQNSNPGRVVVKGFKEEEKL